MIRLAARRVGVSCANSSNTNRAINGSRFLFGGNIVRFWSIPCAKMNSSCRRDDKSSNETTFSCFELFFARSILAKKKSLLEENQLHQCINKCTCHFQPAVDRAIIISSPPPPPLSDNANLDRQPETAHRCTRSVSLAMVDNFLSRKTMQRDR